MLGSLEAVIMAMYLSSITAKIRSLKNTIERNAVKRDWIKIQSEMWKIVEMESVGGERAILC